MANAQSNVTVNISANTGDLDAKLAKQEAAIKTLDGVVNILGGSVELLAGGLALSGAVSEEQAKRFEAAAVGAIAFADGTKRVLDGVKSLTEVQKLYTNSQKISTIATKAFGIALKVATGPIGIALAAITAIGAAILLLKDRFEAVNKVAQFFGNIFQSVAEFVGLAATEQEKFAAAQADAAKESEFQLKLLKAQGAGLEELVNAERKLLQQRVNSYKEGTEERKKAEEELAVFEAQVITDRQKRNEAEAKKAAEKAAKDQEEFEKFKEREAEKLAIYDKETKELARQLAKQQEERDKAAIIQAQRERQVRQQLALDSIKLQQDQAKRDAIYNKEIESNFVLRLKNSSAQLNDFFESEAAASISAGLGIATQFTNLLLQTQDDSTEEAFEASKKYKIAQVVTSAAQSSFEAFASAQKLNAVVPGLGTLLGVALVGAITVASNKAIADINSATFQQSGGGGATTFTSAGNVNFGGGGIPGASQQGGFLALAPPTTSAPPIRAYVVTGDVTDGIEAEQQLQTRRQFGPG